MTFRSVLNIFWLAMLGLAVGFWVRRRWESLCALGVFGAAMAILPAWVGLLATPAREVLGGIAGIGVGVVLARLTVGNAWADEGVASKPH